MKWPNTADGDVFRRLEDNNFDFSKKYAIDFNIDFEYWPPKEEAIAEIRKIYPDTRIYHPDSEDLNNNDEIGYLQFQIISKLTYDLVINIQEEVSSIMKKHGGWCESWGVLH